MAAVILIFGHAMPPYNGFLFGYSMSTVKIQSVSQNLTEIQFTLGLGKVL